MRCEVIAVYDEWNMRERRTWEDIPEFKKMKRGQMIVAFNKRCTIAQYVVRAKGFYFVTYAYPPQGKVFDLEVLLTAVASGYSIDLDARAFEGAERIAA